MTEKEFREFLASLDSCALEIVYRLLQLVELL